ncbi:putative TetR family transcriptional regulator [Gordonia effusa NBRC 100432]|uniref:Putative TetR family transcriptional regulator n=1 Tax=Gordonia effusa NBRC 100432 TaxID=1077974 RepID=H0R3X2_9ACTN|nr:TetR/AcrR family transcriptional regulator [Gordonia effusa]GAB19773.1 putative TetR family transcriptional regulator [Gordonia effusa NBRC 100432]
MTGERKGVSRAEAQQQTRETVLSAAETLFLKHGLHGTTTAKIAAAAGRTQGAIYANFSSKENLCAEVLLRRYLEIFGDLMATVGLSNRDIDGQVDAVVAGWKMLVQDSDLVSLAAEYAFAVRNNSDQLAISRGHIEMGRGLANVALLGAVPDSVTNEQRERVLNGVMALSTGLAVGNVLGFLDEDAATELLRDTLRLWHAELLEP